MPIMDENDVSLPKATLSKMIKEFMPPELRLAGDATDMLIECCTEFVSLVSSESNEVSTEEKRNTIYPEHVIRALRTLGFQEFVPEVTATWEHWKEGNKCGHRNGGKKTAADAAGLTEEQQIEIQQQLFAQARARSFQLPEPPASAPSTSQAAAMQPPPPGSSAQGQPSSSTAPAAPPMPRTVSRTASSITQTASAQPLNPSPSSQSTTTARHALLPPSASSGTLSVSHTPPQPGPGMAKAREEEVQATPPSTIITSGSDDPAEVPTSIASGYRMVPQPAQQPMLVVQQPQVEASGQGTQPHQGDAALDLQQMNGQVVVLGNGTVVSLQDLLLHVAQASAAEPAPQAHTTPARAPPQPQAVSLPLLPASHPRPRPQAPRTDLATLLAGVQEQLNRQQASGRRQARSRHPETEPRCSNSAPGDPHAPQQGTVLLVQQPGDGRGAVYSTGLQRLAGMAAVSNEVQMTEAAPRGRDEDLLAQQRPIMFVPVSAEALSGAGMPSPRGGAMRVHAPAGERGQERRSRRDVSPRGGAGVRAAGPKDPRRVA